MTEPKSAAQQRAENIIDSGSLTPDQAVSALVTLALVDAVRELTKEVTKLRRDPEDYRLHPPGRQSKDSPNPTLYECGVTKPNGRHGEPCFVQGVPYCCGAPMDKRNP